MYLFRNDYSFGAHPKVLSALGATNLQGNVGYGEDAYCRRAEELLLDLCQCPAGKVEFLIGGTQVNAVAMAAFLRPWEGILTATSSHLNGHEAGAVEATGHKLLLVPTGTDGKLRPEQLVPLLEEHRHPHTDKPRVVEIADATESGAVYTRDELSALSSFCRENGLLLYVDGARLGAALTSPQSDLTLPDLARFTDAFTIGGTKNGALMGEALVLVNPDLQPDFFRIKKQMGGVLAKGWLLGAQFEALFRDGLYFEMARHGNAMAARLQAGLKALGWQLWVDSPTNQIFVVVDQARHAALQELCAFEDWCPAQESGLTVIRLVTCFATAPEDVDGFLAAAARL